MANNRMALLATACSELVTAARAACGGIDSTTTDEGIHELLLPLGRAARRAQAVLDTIKSPPTKRSAARSPCGCCGLLFTTSHLCRAGKPTGECECHKHRGRAPGG